MKNLNFFVLTSDADFLHAYSGFITTHYPGLINILTADSGKAAAPLLNAAVPDVVIFDTSVPDVFELFQSYSILPFELICVSKNKAHAFDAAQLGVMAYWLKPVSEAILAPSVTRAVQRIHNRKWEMLGTMLNEMRENASRQKRVALHTEKGTRLVDADDIVYCQADNNYTNVVLANGERLLLSQTLKKYEEQMAPYGFLRTHQTYLVNPKHIVNVSRGRFATITLSNLHTAGLAQSQKATITEWLRKNS